ncbi:MAG: hypothetical protein ACP5F3_00030 [Candidatus Syntrophosphaera sp.]
MKHIIITSLALFCASLLGALTIVDPEGISHTFDPEALASEPRQEFETLRDKDGTARLDTWEGFRLDALLKEMIEQPYTVVRFESEDNYMVNLSQAEFDTLACWLVFSRDGEAFPDKGSRVIFPTLRDMKWVWNPQRIVFEDFDPLGMPASFEFLDERLKEENLLEDPAPFTNTRGYYFADLLPKTSRDEACFVVLYSADGMKLSLEYPRHLEGAILEATDDGLNLKSSQIPGGMWLKGIIYIQIDDFALIHTGNLDALIALNRVMDWQLSPDVHFIVHTPRGESRIPLNDLLAKPELLSGVRYFELVP